MVTAGFYDIVLACGSEKLYHEDKSKSLGAFSSAVDIEDPDGAVNVVKRIALEIGKPFDASTVGVNRSIFMDIYSVMAKKHMKKYSSTKEHFAMVAAKLDLLEDRFVTKSGKAIANLATEELSHPAPVFHGDTIHVETEVLSVRPSRSRPGQGATRGQQQQHPSRPRRCRPVMCWCRWKC